ncbi:Late embryogenesis abundant protein, LEA_2 subgroup [Dillenia turbinata]|uniref:Late embryogenesis abundant protein, LEA_2 subgroup n=1 Tax=Dillenia turbinata TaxID=194707 RepID=A0AAN8U7Q6_9MAGN
MVGVFALIIVGLRPQKPAFTPQTINIEAYEFDTLSGSLLYVSSVLSLTLLAQNPNKVKLTYHPSRLHVFYQGIRIGVISVPGFDQPAHSSNISIHARALLSCVNLIPIIAGRKTIIQMQILGDITAHLHLLRIITLRIKVLSLNMSLTVSLTVEYLSVINVALDCDLSADKRSLALLFSNIIHTTITKILQDHPYHLDSSLKIWLRAIDVYSKVFTKA